MDLREVCCAVKVDDRIALRTYFRLADNLLQQANIFRDEKNIIDLYVMLLRFSSLVSESIPLHQDYKGLDQETKRGYKKKLLRALKELEELKPKVEEEISKLNKFNAANKQSKQKASSSESPSAMTNDVSSNFNGKQGVWPTHSLQRGPLIYPTAQYSAKDVEVPMEKTARISLRIGERVPYTDAIPRISPRGSYHWGNRKSQGASSSGNGIQNNSPWSNINSPATETLPEDLISAQVPSPSAPPIENLVMDDAPIDFPLIHSPSADSFVATAYERRDNILAGSLCAVCMDAPTEGACVPCGHMAGCMTCLNEIKTKSWGCPVCRVKIEMVLHLFPV